MIYRSMRIAFKVDLYMFVSICICSCWHVYVRVHFVEGNYYQTNYELIYYPRCGTGRKRLFGSSLEGVASGHVGHRANDAEQERCSCFGLRSPRHHGTQRQLRVRSVAHDKEYAEPVFSSGRYKGRCCVCYVSTVLFVKILRCYV